ncbi:MAG: HEAT repeat domain-containing protein [Pirellulaceae bacterium]
MSAKDRTTTCGAERIASVLVAVAALVFVFAFAAPAVAVETVSIMYQDPLLLKPVIEQRFPPGIGPLWIQALQRPEREMQRQAASAIAVAHPQGLTGLEAAIDPLMKLLQQPDVDRLTRLTVAQALVVLDARQAASLLCEQLDPHDLDMAELIEPALARWEHAPMRKVWTERLAGDVVLRRMHILAIRGLSALKATEALPRLLELALDETTGADVRLEAALSLGQMQATGLIEPARKLAADKSPNLVLQRLIAARMLASHRGPDTETLLSELATDPQTAVRTIALGQLFHIDPELVLKLIDQTISSDDVNVRRWGVEAVVAKPTPPRLATLAPMLHDIDPDLRCFVCDSLLELSKDASLREAVVNQGRQVLDVDEWRGQEQAILLLVTLDDKSIADQLLGLLAATRPEVHTTAAWGLCQLQVPATADAILDVYTKNSESFLTGGSQRAGMHAQLSYLAQALGRLKVAAADGVLRKYVPKNLAVHRTARAAAIWALGLIHAEQPDDKLADQFLERLLDAYSMVPEDAEVARMSAVSLGRLKAAHTLEGLRHTRAISGLQSPIGHASAWAIQQITGEAIGEIEPIVEMQSGWFLTPYSP